MVQFSLMQAPPPPDASRPDDLAGNGHRQFIGYVGLILPFFITRLARRRDGDAAVENLDSISAYYYTGANAAFVGMLVALAVFLFFYRGYKKDKSTNKPSLIDIILAWIASVAALVVAFFPTKAPEGFRALSWWTERIGEIHFGGAVVLFTMFAVFCLWRFPKSAEGEKNTPWDKKMRNAVYYVCGGGIIVCMAWGFYNASKGQPIFWPEAWALIAFALSWLIKGYAHTELISLLSAMWKRRRTGHPMGRSGS